MMAESSRRVREVLHRFEQSNVWVIGDSMLDENVEGEVTRISPDAPVQVVHVSRTDYRLGGAANVAHGIVELGGQVQLLSVVGDDGPGRTLRALCEQAGIGTIALGVEDRRPTIRKVRVVARTQHLLRLDWEQVIPVSDELRESLWQGLSALPAPDVIVISDYAKGLLSRAMNGQIVEWASHRSIPVLVDPKTTDFTFYRGATLVKPNRKEIEEAVGETWVDHPDWYDAKIRPLLHTAELKGMLVTLGEGGMALVQHNQDVTRIATDAREVYDVTGAGDTVIGTLALARAAGCDWAEASHIANCAAGIAVSKLGTAIVRRQELAAALSPDARLGAVDLDGLLEQIEWWRLQGRKIVFTNGCFDLLHVGHVRLLQQAARYGDVLIVGVNEDASVSRLKGPERPVVPFADRVEVLAALDCVDSVVGFSEDTPAGLIARLQPDVLVKGGDYSLELVVGRDVVEARGGEVVIVPLVEGRSTTGLLERVRE